LGLAAGSQETAETNNLQFVCQIWVDNGEKVFRRGGKSKTGFLCGNEPTAYQ
jgi:hypothetical protein